MGRGFKGLNVAPGALARKCRRLSIWPILVEALPREAFRGQVREFFGAFGHRRKHLMKFFDGHLALRRWHDPLNDSAWQAVRNAIISAYGNRGR